MRKLDFVTWQSISEDNWKTSIDRVDDILAPAFSINSASNPVVKGMYGDLSVYGTISSIVHEKGKKIYPYLCQPHSLLSSIISGGKLNTLIGSIASTLSKYNLDGICLDFENDVSPTNYANLIPKLKVAIGDKFIDITCHCGQCDAYKTPDADLNTMQYIRYAFILAYDMWVANQDVRGSSAGLDVLKVQLKKWTDKGYNPAQLGLALPGYGDSGAKHYDYVDFIDTVPFSPSADSVTISDVTYWYGGVNTKKAITKYLIDNGFGCVAFFADVEDVEVSDSRSLLKAICDTVDGEITTPTEPPANETVSTVILDGVIYKLNPGETAIINSTTPTITPAILNYVPPSIAIV